MKRILILLTLTSLLGSCRKNELNPASPSTAPLSGRSVLIYSNSFPGLLDTPGIFEVTAYDPNGLPVQARTTTYYPMYVSSGTYTSTIKLAYDAQLRIKKTVQTHDQFAPASCCPGSVAFDPARQIVNEYDYQGNTQNITHEISYSVDAGKAEKKILGETFRNFTPTGQLLQEKRDGQVLYEAAYDANGNVASETLLLDATVLAYDWANTYDANKRLVSRKIKGTDIFENNTYDSQGRLLRRVTNLYSLYPFSLPNVGKLVDYAFNKSDVRRAISFSYFNGKLLASSPRVLTFEYAGEETRVTQQLYVIRQPNNGADQPGFDFAQIPKESLIWIEQTKWRFNKWKKVANVETDYPYISSELSPDQRESKGTQSFTYTYDDAGNPLGIDGYTIYGTSKRRSDMTQSIARYKTF